jgi:hypothetical protein
VTAPGFRFCDERGEHGFGWVTDDLATRTSHALAAGGRVWLVDPVDWPDAVTRALELGEPAGVVQLLDRHNRDCARLAERLGIPHLSRPDEIAVSPFRPVPVVQRRRWAETALWWAEERTLVVAEAVGTNRFYTAGKAPVGVHLVLRLIPPKVLGRFGPAHLLVGHGEGVHGPGTADALARALATARRGLPGMLLRLPLALRS